MPGNQQIILGVDPGTTIMGYGLIQSAGPKQKMIAMGVIELKKLPGHYEKLKMIFERITQLIVHYKPDALAVEAPFYGKNVQSMLKLGRAQGAAISAALAKNIPVFEYAPLKVKQSITGHGNASKQQVAAMLQNILKIDELPEHLDATDGLAVALCHCYQGGNKISGEGVNSWKEFIRKNPGRVK